MDGLGSADILLFGDFRLDRRGGVLYRLAQGAAAMPVVLGSRGLGLLGLLVARQGEVLSKDEIMRAVWPGRVVEEANLNVQISKLRHLLDHNREEGSCIQTLPGRGYCFVAPVTRSDADAQSIPQGVAHPRPRLSIVVLPFANLSEDREQRYFADGITDDLTTDLSRLADMFVISRNTAFTYRNKPADTKQIGRDLGVRYVLEGTIRRSGKQVRVNVQLIDAETDAHLWAERFDCDMGDLFALQNEITSRIAVALDLELVGVEAARPTDHPDALDYILRGRAAIFSKPRTRDAYAEGINLCERSLALDPRSVAAQSWLAIALAGRVLDKMTDSTAADIARAEGLIGQALAASPRSPLAHFAQGQLLRAQHRYEEAIPEYETVLAFNRNWVFAITNLGWCKFLTGSIEEGIRLHEQAICLGPRDPHIGIWYYRIGRMRLLQSRLDEAIVWYEKALHATPAQADAYIHAYLASAYALKGETERAAAELAEARTLSRDGLFSSIARLKADGGYFGVAKIRALFETTFFAGLRKAGMPEE
jgi:TolB-like protein/tetratricopeptide (TPR) repeat protein